MFLFIPNTNNSSKTLSLSAKNIYFFRDNLLYRTSLQKNVPKMAILPSKITQPSGGLVHHR